MRLPILISLVLLGLVCLPACDEMDDSGTSDPFAPPPDAPARGQMAINRYGCAGCHTIPGITGADAVVGPPLTRIGSQTYVAVLRNTPDNLTRWIHDPPAVDPKTPMPNLHVSESDARDIAAYLATLR